MTYIGFFETAKVEIQTGNKVINFSEVNAKFFYKWYKLLFSNTNRINTKLGCNNPTIVYHGLNCFDIKIEFEKFQTFDWYKQTLQKDFLKYLLTGLRKEANILQVQAFYVAYKTMKNYENK